MQKVKAIFFLFLFLISQVSFSLDLHYCHTTLTDVSFFGNTNCVCLDTHHEEHNEGCQSHKKSCDHSTKIKKEKKDCCSTETVEVEKSNEVLGTTKISLENNYWIQEEFVFTVFASASVQEILPENYIPPLLVRDVRVEVQSFQI